MYCRLQKWLLSDEDGTLELTDQDGTMYGPHDLVPTSWGLMVAADLVRMISQSLRLTASQRALVILFCAAAADGVPVTPGGAISTTPA